MAAESDFLSGIDPTSFEELNGSQIKQLVDEATPRSTKGLIIASTDTPDVANNPRYARFLWLDLNGINADGNAPYVLNYYNPDTPAWEPIFLGLTDIDGAYIQDGTIVPTDALSGDGLADDQILITNANAWVLSTVANAIANESITLAKLVKGSADKQVIRYNGTSWAISQLAFDDISTAVGAIEVEKLEKAISASYLLAPDPSDSLKTKWFPITDVITRNFILYAFAADKFPWSSIELADANYMPVMDSLGVAWTFVDKRTLGQSLSKVVITKDFDDWVNIAIGDNSIWATAHGLGAVPDIMDLKLRCKTTFDDGTLAYNEGDVISSSSVMALGSPSSFPLFQLQADSSQLLVNGYRSDPSIYSIKKKGGDLSGGGLEWVNLNPNYYQYFDIVITLIKFNS